MPLRDFIKMGVGFGLFLAFQTAPVQLFEQGMLPHLAKVKNRARNSVGNDCGCPNARERDNVPFQHEWPYHDYIGNHDKGASIIPVWQVIADVELLHPSAQYR
jgi:hypothetical protein